MAYYSIQIQKELSRKRIGSNVFHRVLILQYLLLKFVYGQKLLPLYKTIYLLYASFMVQWFYVSQSDSLSIVSSAYPSPQLVVIPVLPFIFLHSLQFHLYWKLYVCVCFCFVFFNSSMAVREYFFCHQWSSFSFQIYLPLVQWYFPVNSSPFILSLFCCLFVS